MSLFHKSDLFGQFFRIGSAEAWSHSGADVSVELNLAGVDPKTVRVTCIGSNHVRVYWTDRFGAAQTRSWDLAERVFDVRATLTQGLLVIRATLQPPAPEPVEREVKVELK